MSSVSLSSFPSTIALPPAVSQDPASVASLTFVSIIPSPDLEGKEPMPRVLKPSKRQIARTTSKYALSSSSTVVPQISVPMHIPLPYQTQITTSAYIYTSERIFAVGVPWSNLDNRLHNQVQRGELHTRIQCITDGDVGDYYRITTRFKDDTTVGAIERAVGNIFNADVYFLHNLEKLSSNGTVKEYNDELRRVQNHKNVLLTAVIWKNRPDEKPSLSKKSKTEKNDAKTPSALPTKTTEKSVLKKIFSCW